MLAGLCACFVRFKIDVTLNSRVCVCVCVCDRQELAENEEDNPEFRPQLRDFAAPAWAAQLPGLNAATNVVFRPSDQTDSGGGIAPSLRNAGMVLPMLMDTPGSTSAPPPAFTPAAPSYGSAPPPPPAELPPAGTVRAPGALNKHRILRNLNIHPIQVQGGRAQRKCGSGGWLQGQKLDELGVFQAGDDDGENTDRMTKMETRGEDNAAKHDSLLCIV